MSPCVSENGALSQNSRGARTSRGVPDPIYYPDPSAGREQTPRLGGPEPPRVRRRRYARGCQASSGRLAHLPHSMRETLSALCHSRARGDFRQAVLLIARYQGAQYSRWRHSRYVRQSATPVRHDNSATEYHNAYAVDPTIYAATYTASTGASPMGQLKTPSVRVYRTMKCIRQEILQHRSIISVYLV